MIKIVKFNDEASIKYIENHFCEVYKQKNELKNEFLNNPYTRVYAFIDNSQIIGIIHINDIYDRYEINNIYVLPEHRNKIIASLLMEKIIKEAEENKKINITLEVRKNNFPAINLYKKCGFVEKAVRKGYYKGIDGILMEKEMM